MLDVRTMHTNMKQIFFWQRFFPHKCCKIKKKSIVSLENWYDNVFRFAVPCGANNSLVIDPSNNTVNVFGDSIEGTESYSCLVEAQDGKLYAIPRNSKQILIIDPVLQTDIVYWHSTFRFCQDVLIRS